MSAESVASGPVVPGKVHRYRVTDWWGDAPEQIKAVVGTEEGFCIDFWRGYETTWEIMRDHQIVGGWSGHYVGVSPPARALIDGSGSVSKDSHG